jgi:hypothetical protein
MDESRPRPGPGHAAPPTPRGTSRRWFLAGGGAVVLGAGGGVAADLLGTGSTRKPPPRPPAALAAAAEAERALIADLDATTGGSAEVRAVIVQARADHADHLAAVTALLAPFRRPAGTPSPGPSAAAGTPRTLAQLRAAEQSASASAARRAAGLGAKAATAATLLASIAACEATHAELLR